MYLIWHNPILKIPLLIHLCQNTYWGSYYISFSKRHCEKRMIDRCKYRLFFFCKIIREAFLPISMNVILEKKNEKRVWWQNATFHVHEYCFLIFPSCTFMHIKAMTGTFQLTPQRTKILPDKSETEASAAWTRLTGTILQTWWNYITERIHIAIRYLKIFQYDYTT